MKALSPTMRSKAACDDVEGGDDNDDGNENDNNDDGNDYDDGNDDYDNVEDDDDDVDEHHVAVGAPWVHPVGVHELDRSLAHRLHWTIHLMMVIIVMIMMMMMTIVMIMMMMVIMVMMTTGWRWSEYCQEGVGGE